MSAAVETYRDDLEATYAVDFSRDHEPTKKRARFPEYKRRGSAPSRVSGMHCRRNKRWTWGTGRGARLLNTRAFAGALIAAIASIVSGSVASGASVYVNIPGDPTAPAAPSGYGVVAQDFQISATEVTTTEYAAFLTATGAPNGTFKVGQRISLQGSTFVADAGFENHPVVNVNWYDAARFVNWLVSGSTESGAYALNGGNVVVPRTPGAAFFLPSVDEWYKAAYFNPTSNSWNTFAVDGAPNAAPPVGNSGSANYSNAVGGTTPVSNYSLAVTSYGLYDMLGNAAEILETSGPWNGNGNGGTGIMRTGGNWFGPQLPTSSLVLNPADPAYTNGQIGFRVAAVPEPSSIALAGVGIAGLAGFEWSRRRKALARQIVG
jgi:sulfatase modifying factor 1